MCGKPTFQLQAWIPTEKSFTEYWSHREHSPVRQLRARRKLLAQALIQKSRRCVITNNQRHNIAGKHCENLDCALANAGFHIQKLCRMDSFLYQTSMRLAHSVHTSIQTTIPMDVIKNRAKAKKSMLARLSSRLRVRWHSNLAWNDFVNIRTFSQRESL